VDAAAVNSRFLTQYAAQQGLQYREVFMSEPFADVPVIAHNRLQKDKVDAIQKALLGMKNDPRAAVALEAAGFGGFAAAADKDYDSQRQVYRKIPD
jgi:ABC-type phosphate/phosphonate transport system substrate-binding protein